MSGPTHAMVAAAGIGTRMRPLTDTLPKALVKLAGKSLLDHQLDRLTVAGVQSAVVNIHHFADQMQTHLQARKPPPKIIISDERNCLLETGGALVRAARYLGNKPFFVTNVDAIWRGHDTALPDLWQTMAQLPDALAVLLLARRQRSLGLETAGDFHLDQHRRLRRRKPGETSDFYYAGVQVFDPKLLDGVTEQRFSTNLFWDKALAQGRLYGLELDGFWMHVGDPQSLKLAEEKLREIDQ